MIKFDDKTYLLHITHTDSDGIGCVLAMQLVASECHIPTYTIRYKEAGSMQNLINIINDIDVDANMLPIIAITDLSVNSEEDFIYMMDAINLFSSKFISLECGLIYIDHHNSFIKSTINHLLNGDNPNFMRPDLWLDFINKIKSTELGYYGLNCNLSGNVQMSAALRTFLTLQNNKLCESHYSTNSLNIAYSIFKDISDYDTWTWKDKTSAFKDEIGCINSKLAPDWINVLTKYMDRDDLVELLSNVINSTKSQISSSTELKKIVQNYNAWYKRKEVLIPHAINKYLIVEDEKLLNIIFDELGYKPDDNDYIDGIIIAMGIMDIDFNNDIANKIISDRYESVLVLSFDLVNMSISARSDGSLAKKCMTALGGGGHDKAAGAKPAFDKFKSILWMYFDILNSTQNKEVNDETLCS